MRITGFDKLSLLNYPGVVSCTVFTSGCNYRCPFCQNGTLAKDTAEKTIPEEEIFAYLEKRSNIIDGICVSGGEPTVQKDLIKFLTKLRGYNIKIKIDTNGSNPLVIKEILAKNLVDYIAMDIKNTSSLYDQITGVKAQTDKIKESIELLKNSKIDYEFRTTIVKEFHNLDNIKTICKAVDSSKYYLQNFVDSDNVLTKNLHGFSSEELKNIEKIIKGEFPNVIVRGI